MAARRHAFVAMPFGTKPGPKDPEVKGSDAEAPLIDFNRVYGEYIKPALESAGFEAFRAEPRRPGRRHRHGHVSGIAGRGLGRRRPDIDNPMSGTSSVSVMPCAPGAS